MSITSLLEHLDKHEPAEAQRLRDYDAARAYFGTSASYVSRKMDFMDELWPDETVPPCSSTWLAQRFMVSMWKALGSPVKGTP